MVNERIKLVNYSTPHNKDYIENTGINAFKELFESNASEFFFSNSTFNEMNKELELRINPKALSFNNTECVKNGSICSCYLVSNHTGFYIKCNKCDMKKPKDTLFLNPPNITNLWSVYGVINNNVTINKTINENTSLNLTQVLLFYPLHIDNFKCERTMKKFQNILLTHKESLIVNYIDYFPYKLYGNGIYYDNQNKEINECDIYEKFVDAYLSIVKNQLYYYENNKEYPIIDNKCYNEHIIKNLDFLFINIKTNKNNFLPFLKQKLQVEEYSFKTIKNNDFFKYIYSSRNRNDSITSNDMYNYYTIWYDKSKCNENKLTKNELKIKIEDYIKDTLKNKNWENKRIMVNGNRSFCWTYIIITNEFKDKFKIN
jgi:hypothetical protein